MTPEELVLSWFDPDTDGVLDQYAKDDSDLPQRVVDAVKKHIPDVIRDLGGGDNGHAWLTKDGVVKLTIDEAEALAATKISGKTHPNVVSYSDTLQMGGLPIFILKQDFAGERIIDPHVIDVLNNLGDPPSHMGDIEQLTNAHRDSKLPMASRRAFKQLASGMKWLSRQGVEFFDLSSHNVVKLGDTYKIIDLGVSKVKWGKKPVPALSFEDRLSLALYSRHVLLD